MDYAAALAKLKSLELEGKDELVSAIEGKVSTLEGDKFSVIGEKRTVTQKNQALQTALEAIAKAVGVEGDIDAILETAQGKVTGLASKVTELETAKSTLETSLTEATGKVQTYERKGKLATIATAAGANAAVLERLFGNELDTLVVGEDGVVKLGDKPLREAVEADPALSAFAPALFVAGPTDPPKPGPAPKLPAGGPGGTPKESNPVGAAISKLRFAVPGKSI